MRSRLIIVVLAALATGCATRPESAAAPPRDDRPLMTTDGRARSLATDAAPLRRLLARAPQPVDPWYASRNDARAAVTVGIQRPTLLYSETHTIDRQMIIGGESRTFLHQTTRRGRVIEAVQ